MLDEGQQEEQYRNRTKPCAHRPRYSGGNLVDSCEAIAVYRHIIREPDEVLQQLFQIGQQLQIDANNREKARKMMGQLQDEEYKRQLRENWKTVGGLPPTVIVPNGQGQMEVPVESVTPADQVKNKPSTTANQDAQWKKKKEHHIWIWYRRR